VYLEALCKELTGRDLPYLREVLIPVVYKGEMLKCKYRADLVCFGSLLIELKAQSGLTEVDDAQVINYLRATEISKALLLNFGTPKLQIRRLILTDNYRAGARVAERS
jgi:GxxExxY protein